MKSDTSAARRVLVLRCPDWLDDDGSDDYGGSDSAGSNSAAARAFERVVAIVENFCPQVEVLRPGVCAIATRGPARYFGGEAQLAAGLAEAVAQAGVASQAGIADGLFAAGLAARAGPTGLLVPPGETPEFLAGLPVGVLDMPELCELLPRLGIETLGQLAALPSAEAASRFGPPGKLASRLARGLDPRPLIPRPPAADESVQQEFDPPADQSEPVIFAAKALADQMHDRLAAAGLACVRIQVQVRLSDGQELSRIWRHDGLLSALAVAERVRWQLDGWRSASGDRAPDQDGWPGTAGITRLRLVPDQLVRATGRQLALWGDAVPSDRVARAAIRVQAMLGHAQVTRPVLAGGRRPADQVLLVPFGDAETPQRPADRPWADQIPAPSPATVFDVPLAASVTDDSGQPVTVSGRAQLSAPPTWLSAAGGPARAVTAWAGPWPITERWWDPVHARRQARFQLVTEDGTAWLAALQDGRWLIEASYD
ncbi:MAG TPA: DNA polymerase Y family protein [Streptosporangiaceae bacterium]|nr:DNA polymerase Y family protein [Streptosporangiaceae bacterium]